MVVSSATLIASFRDVGEDGNTPTDKLIPRCSVDMCLGNGTWYRLELMKIVNVEGIKEAAETLVGGSLREVRGISVGGIAVFRIASEHSSL
mmetsp:Transcript_24712/g.30262  ORF Transcript_24712/g.30262 Transcript_24712/m.30262 type:complete len:91 (-) Transcript_24712:1422-1694(-)